MYIADLHIHSKYSRATSKNGDIPHLDLWARRKGIGLVGTGDFTHPAWREEMAEALEPAEAGLYRIREENRIRDFCDFSTSPRFVVSGEISCIYKQDGKVRRPNMGGNKDGIRTNLQSDRQQILGRKS